MWLRRLTPETAEGSGDVVAVQACLGVGQLTCGVGGSSSSSPASPTHPHLRGGLSTRVPTPFFSRPPPAGTPLPPPGGVPQPTAAARRPRPGCPVVPRATYQPARGASHTARGTPAAASPPRSSVHHAMGRWPGWVATSRAAPRLPLRSQTSSEACSQSRSTRGSSLLGKRGGGGGQPETHTYHTLPPRPQPPLLSSCPPHVLSMAGEARGGRRRRRTQPPVLRRREPPPRRQAPRRRLGCPRAPPPSRAVLPQRGRAWDATDGRQSPQAQPARGVVSARGWVVGVWRLSWRRLLLAEALCVPALGCGGGGGDRAVSWRSHDAASGVKTLATVTSRS